MPMPSHHPHAREALVARNMHYWSRGWGETTAQKMTAILADPEWCRLVDQELDLEPLDEDARSIRVEISRMEHCHESFAANAEVVVGMVTSLGRKRPDAKVLDCGEVDTQREERIADYLAAIRRWRAGQSPRSALDRTVASLCGPPDARKRPLVDHLIAKLVDDGYTCGGEDWSRTEALISHLEHCAVHWERSLTATLKQIGTGIRTAEFHADGGWSACGDAPDRVAELRDLLRDLDAWLDDRQGAELGERTPVKTWLVGSLVKHIRSQQHTGRIVR